MNQEKIGKFIAQCRKNKNLTQEQLAEKLGVTNKSISRWENGKTMPDYSILKDLCNVLDIEVNEFLSGEKINKNEIQIHSNENLDLILKEYYRMKKQRNIFKICVIVLLCLVFTLVIIGTISWLFSEQYNLNGISHYLVITIDENQPREYIGNLDNHKIYVEKLNLEGTNFRTIEAKDISIKDAIDKKIISIKDWKNHAWKIINDEEAEVLQFENYEIECTDDYCIIRPITK